MLQHRIRQQARAPIIRVPTLQVLRRRVRLFVDRVHLDEGAGAVQQGWRDAVDADGVAQVGDAAQEGEGDTFGLPGLFAGQLEGFQLPPPSAHRALSHGP